MFLLLQFSWLEPGFTNFHNKDFVEETDFSVPLFCLYKAFLGTQQIWQHVSAYKVFMNCNI